MCRMAEKRRAAEPLDTVRGRTGVFRNAAEGMAASHREQLNREGREVFHRKGQGIRDKRIASGWDADRIVELVASEAPRGYYQPYTRDPHTGKREPSGDPIRCFPVIVDDATWHIANAHRRRRAETVAPDRAPEKARVANLLSGNAICDHAGRVSRFIQAT